MPTVRLTLERLRSALFLPIRPLPVAAISVSFEPHYTELAPFDSDTRCSAKFWRCHALSRAFSSSLALTVRTQAVLASARSYVAWCSRSSVSRSYDIVHRTVVCGPLLKQVVMSLPSASIAQL
jgi:hypothetical protein